jgi:hypothetical protein
MTLNGSFRYLSICSRTARAAVANKAIQTDDLEGGSLSSRSAWLRTAPLDCASSSQPLASQRLADCSIDMDSSSIGAYSVPSLIGKSGRKELRGDSSVASEPFDTIKSALTATPPSKGRGHRLKARKLKINALDPSFELKSEARDLDVLKALQRSRRERVSQSMHAGAEGAVEGQFPDISVSGRKFVHPILLPRI